MTESRSGREPDGPADVRVSVAMTTYNHAPYVVQAVESVLAQQTTFPFELVVGDDCSTDGTRELLQELQRRHPDRLRLVLPARNLGGSGTPMLARTIEAVRAPYVAKLDGDDYWTSPHKLQRQAAYLDAHPECSLCFHDVLEIAEDGRRPPRRVNEATPAEFTGLPELFQSCYIAACSPMFRREAVSPLPAWYATFTPGDWPLYVLAAERGRIGYIDEVMGVYRIHGDGVWNRLDKTRQYEMLLRFYDQLHAATAGRYAARTRRAEAKWHYKLALAHNQAGRRREAWRSAARALRRCPVGGDVDRTRLLKELVHPFWLAARAAWGRRV